MNTITTAAEVAEFLYREANLIDDQEFEAWGELFTDDAVFWVPAWKSEHEPTDNPKTELALVYCASRNALVDRIWRFESNLSVASMPLARTSHLISNVVIDQELDTEIKVRSNWTSHVYNPKYKTQHVYFGKYEHVLRQEAGVWKIARKKITLKNDFIPTVLDIYMV